MGFWY